MDPEQFGMMMKPMGMLVEQLGKPIEQIRFLVKLSGIFAADGAVCPAAGTSAAAAYSPAACRRQYVNTLYTSCTLYTVP